jgi:microcystin-dependent protein
MDTHKFVQAQRLRLAGSGCTSTATSIDIQSLQFPDETNITMSDFGDTGYITLEPGTSKEENISFTGITQNADGTATLTGVTRGLDFHAPYTENSSLKKSHAGGAIAVISNSAPFYNELSAKDNDETVTGQWTFTDPNIPQMDTYSAPTDDEQLATKKYVDDNASGAAAIDRVVMSGTAGATLSAGDIIYLDTSDGEWKKADASTASTSENVMLGIAQGSGTDGNTISGGVLVRGKDQNQSGLTANNVYYLSDTAGEVSTSAGTVSIELGYAIDTDTIYFQPKFQSNLTSDEQDALEGTSGTPSSSNKYVTDNDFPSGIIFPYGGGSAPSGYLLCDGSAVSRSTYSDLFNAIGDSYGAGDGSTTFNLPDLQGRVPVGKDTGTFSSLGDSGGEEEHTLTDAESGLPSHTHKVPLVDSGSGGTEIPETSENTLTGNTVTTESTGGDNASSAHNNLQPYQVVNYIIRT